MITIIHGDDIVLSRKYLQEQKQKTDTPYVFDGNVDLEDIIQIAQGGGLFNNEKKIFIENFFSKNILSSDKGKNIINYVNRNDSSLDIFFWEGKELQKKFITFFSNPTIKTFKIPQTIFLFLDNIKPGNYKNAISLFHKALESTVAELIFFMLQRQFRLLLALSKCHPERSEGSLIVRDSSPLAQNDNGTIDEITRLAPWQRGKLERQAKLFSIDNLLYLYRRLYEIELNHKTGNLPYSLTHAIDFFLFSI